MKFHDIVKEIEKIAPLKYGENWDNTGIQINTGNDNIKKILVVLDINRDVLEEAIEKKVDLIITHHPLMFSVVKKIDNNTVQGEYLITAIKNEISVYSAHLTFDNCPGGNNDYLADKIGLKSTKRVSDNPGIIGELPKKISTIDLVNTISDKWDIPMNTIKVAGDINASIKKIALCSGAGGDFLKEAVVNQCQVLITADTKLHQAQKAIAKGIVLIDCGHYDTEKSFASNMGESLRKRLKGKVEVIEAERNINPFVYM